MVWYVVHVGRVPGIYRTWRDCHAQVHRYRGNCYKKYNTEAEAFAAYHGANILNNNDQDLAMEIEEMPALQIEEMPAGNMTFLGRLLLGLRRMLCFN
jgi:viroplasmin and RNaseH domain-containing protein